MRRPGVCGTINHGTLVTHWDAGVNSRAVEGRRGRGGVVSCRIASPSTADPHDLARACCARSAEEALSGVAS